VVRQPLFGAGLKVDEIELVVSLPVRRPHHSAGGLLTEGLKATPLLVRESVDLWRRFGREPTRI
jgi:hypothetical protein